MLSVLLVAFAPLAAIGAARAQTDAKPPAKLASVPASSAIDVPKIPYTRFVLPNGLVVIVHEDHAAPVVAIDLSYHVGSKDEVPGKRGLAHLFEHMMMEGSAHVEPGEHRRIIQESGGADRAFTWQDRTKFASTVPSNMLETVLWLEAERMAFLPARLDSTRFEREREQVIIEYRQTFLGAPASGFLGGEAMLGGLFPDSHPYHVSPMGDIGELKTTTVADLRAFFDRYYVPNNAVLAIAGDVKTADMRPMVEKYFGGIPRKTAVTHPVVPKVTLTKETRLVLEDRVFNAQLLWFGWIGAPTNDPDRMALTALSGILSGSPNSRLQRALIDERKLAVGLSPVNNQHFDLENSGIFQIVVTAKPGDPMTEIERVADSVIASVRDHGVEPSELRRWRAAFIVGKDVALQTPVEKAHILGEGEIYNRNPVVSLTDIDAANRLTLADIQRVARKYLVPGRVVMSVVPAGKLNMISKPNEPYVNVTPKAP
jgi:zinc protease